MFRGLFALLSCVYILGSSPNIEAGECPSDCKKEGSACVCSGDAAEREAAKDGKEAEKRTKKDDKKEQKEIKEEKKEGAK